MKRWTLLLPLLLAGCNAIFAVEECTLAGCADGLWVELAGTAEGAVRVEVRVPGNPAEGARVFEIECEAGTGCGPLLLSDFTPEVVEILVISNAGATRQTVRPAYEVTYPNGKDCEPRCVRGEVQAVLPAPPPSGRG